MRLKTIASFLLIGFCTLQMACCGFSQNAAVTVKGKTIQIQFDQQMHSKVVASFGKKINIGDYTPSEFVTVQGQAVTDFDLKTHTSQKIADQLGAGRGYLITGRAANLEKQLTVNLYDDWPNIAVYQVTYTNIGTADLVIDSWTSHHYSITAGKSGPVDVPFWTFQPATYESRPDWVLPIKAGFKQENYLGMNASDYGGGTPVADIWRPDAGIGIGHLEMVPKLVSMPILMPDSLAAQISLQYKKATTLKPGESLTTFTTFVAVHQGDYYKTLSDYRDQMIRRGIHFDKNPDTVYEPQWCAWGYERKFTMDQVVNTLPMAKKLGFEWAVLDDGWQTAEGDWYLIKEKFPRGDQDMIDFVNRIKAGGLKPQLWWCPLAVDPGTDLIKNHPEFLLLNEDGSKQDISWWDSYYLCPAYPPVVEFTKGQVLKIMKEWGYQGLKIDGQHLNAAPPCYNPAHHHAYPEEACEKMPEFFKMIYETARSVYPDAVVEICPCGTSYAFHTMPYMNQSVSSDPESSWQIRLKGKTLKALMGADAAYYGDHVELSDGGDDFASQVGIGAVIGTKFTWPMGAARRKRAELTPEREIAWGKWTRIYLDHMLSKGNYRGELYDLGFDRPETHAIEKEGKMYYAFYAPDYKGLVELRGLERSRYLVRDYVAGKEYGQVSGPTARLNVEFKRNLLLVATPE